VTGKELSTITQIETLLLRFADISYNE